IGGAYEMPDGRSFWIDAPVAREMARRVLAALASTPQPASAETDARLLDVLRDESWDLRCFNIPTGGGDADIGWRVIGHWMAEPCERVMGEVFHDDPRAAIRAAIRQSAKGGE
ncbi:hypothetical protein, partial [Rhizorhabdus histidinilytica]|uniref:hypothetical protein n=1 Tax=Rhizorhabdus histidinilytica TaxID=439228 RepID=UPI001ADCA201